MRFSSLYNDSVITHLEFFLRDNREGKRLKPSNDSSFNRWACNLPGGLQSLGLFGPRTRSNLSVGDACLWLTFHWHRNPFLHGEPSLAHRDVLSGSAEYDHVNCACVGDLDCDGQSEIVIGTFGSRLLFYKLSSNGIYEYVVGKTTATELLSAG